MKGAESEDKASKGRKGKSKVVEEEEDEAASSSSSSSAASAASSASSASASAAPPVSAAPAAGVAASAVVAGGLASVPADIKEKATAAAEGEDSESDVDTGVKPSDIEADDGP